MSGGFAPIHVVPEGMPVHTVGFGMRGIMLNRPPTYEVSARWCCVIRLCISCPVCCLNLSGHSLHWSCYSRITWTLDTAFIQLVFWSRFCIYCYAGVSMFVVTHTIPLVVAPIKVADHESSLSMFEPAVCEFMTFIVVLY